MRAVVVDPSSAQKLVLQEVDAPQPLPSEALVNVSAISLNRGEVRSSLAGTQPGARPGWDLAGTVEQAAADGTGPQAGQRVVGILRTRAWAEQAAVPTAQLAVLPEGVSFEQASTLPVAGLTALYGLGIAGSLLARSVLITGASGGVGHLAVQLALESGASEVVGTVRQEKHAAAVQAAGATQVVADETGEGAKALAPTTWSSTAWAARRSLTLCRPLPSTATTSTTAAAAAPPPLSSLCASPAPQPFTASACFKSLARRRPRWAWPA